MSAILSADDLNDFISPGVACIKPVNQNVKAANGNSDEMEIQINSQGVPLEVSKADGTATNLNPAQISLADCLACSGCITSAEEILVAQHSHDELMKVLKEEAEVPQGRVFVASVSHQIRASLATAYGVSVEEMDRLIIDLLVGQMGFTYVVGTSLGRKLSLTYEARNIMERKKRATKLAGPTLSLICPGWVLYAEKTHPYVLPNISEVKSAQQITGCILKTLTAKELGVPRNKVYHLSLMPCFDKKLESARPEADQEQLDAGPDVDCVLTAKELVTLIGENEERLSLVPARSKSLSSFGTINDVYAKFAPSLWPSVEISWSNDDGSSSGGYAYHYLGAVQWQMVSENSAVYTPDKFGLKTIAGRNSDVYELRLTYDGTTVATSAVVNGFKNIQNLVRKLKPAANDGGRPASTNSGKVNPLASRRRARMAKSTGIDNTTQTPLPPPQQVADPSKCDYVEVMACPNGCINGGGQINPPSDILPKQWLDAALTSYKSIKTIDLLTLNPSSSTSFPQDLVQWCHNFCQEFALDEKRLLNTWFHEVEKPSDPTAILLGSKW